MSRRIYRRLIGFLGVRLLVRAVLTRLLIQQLASVGITIFRARSFVQAAIVTETIAFGHSTCCWSTISIGTKCLGAGRSGYSGDWQIRSNVHAANPFYVIRGTPAGAGSMLTIAIPIRTMASAGLFKSYLRCSPVRCFKLDNF
jgi:hypothetical protein